MSVKVMGMVWDWNLPQNEKLVLLAYADHADHNGFSIFPAVSTIAKKTGYSERSVQRITRDLEEKGLLVDDGTGKKGTNRWRIPYIGGDKIAPLPVGGDTEGTKGVTNATERGDTAMTPEPSLTIIKEPSIKLIKEIPEETKIIHRASATDFYNTFGKFHRGEIVRYLDLVDLHGAEKIARVVRWASRKESSRINRSSLMDMLETAATNWSDKEKKNRPAESIADHNARVIQEMANA